jgi:hypothetical protein
MLVTFVCRCGQKAVAREAADDCGATSGRVECPGCGRWGFWHDKGFDCDLHNAPAWGGNDREIVYIARIVLSHGALCPLYAGVDDLGLDWAKEHGTRWLREVMSR